MTPGPQVVRIPLLDITGHHYRTDAVAEGAAIRQLDEHGGPLAPVVLWVRPGIDTHYHLVDGGIRAAAARRRGNAYVDAFVGTTIGQIGPLLRLQEKDRVQAEPYLPLSFADLVRRVALLRELDAPEMAQVMRERVARGHATRRDPSAATPGATVNRVETALIGWAGLTRWRYALIVTLLTNLASADPEAVKVAQRGIDGLTSGDIPTQTVRRWFTPTSPTYWARPKLTPAQQKELIGRAQPAAAALTSVFQQLRHSDLSGLSQGDIDTLAALVRDVHGSAQALTTHIRATTRGKGDQQ